MIASNEDYFSIARTFGKLKYIPLPSSHVIPLGDWFLGSFTSGDFDYFECNSGFYKKLHNAKVIEKITRDEFSTASLSEEKFVFCSRLGFPQAGLTRGSKGSFCSKQQELLEIQEKYKDGLFSAEADGTDYKREKRFKKWLASDYDEVIPKGL